MKTLALLSFFGLPSLLGLAGCATHPPERSLCSAGAACFVENLAKVSLHDLKSNGSAVEASCGYKDAIDEPYRKQCEPVLAATLASLGRWPNQLEPRARAEVQLLERQTCIDTFIPGNEESDCRYHFLVAKIPLKWRQL